MSLQKCQVLFFDYSVENYINRSRGLDTVEESTMSVLERYVAESQDLITIHGKVKDGQPLKYNIAQLQKYHDFII
jgi:hypothetical protein